jgi:hypothetical protein
VFTRTAGAYCFGQGFRHIQQRRLARAVIDESGFRLFRQIGPGVYDRSRPARRHLGEERATRAHRTHQIHRDGSFPFVVADFAERYRIAQPEIVDEDVRRAPELVRHVRRCGLHACGRREIGGYCAALFPRFLPQHVGVAVGDDDFGTFLREQIRDSFTDSMRARRYVRKLSFQLIVHSSAIARRSAWGVMAG